MSEYGVLRVAVNLTMSSQHCYWHRMTRRDLTKRPIRRQRRALSRKLPTLCLQHHVGSDPTQDNKEYTTMASSMSMTLRCPQSSRLSK